MEKRHFRYIIKFSAMFLLVGQFASAQISITKNELPIKIGTTWTTINDTTESVTVNVGDIGENQYWEFHEEINGVEIKQEIVDRDSTPFKSEFSNSNYVMKYDGGLLDLIYSDVFPQIEGDVYFYQLLTDSTVELLGTGFTSSFLSGAAHFQPPNVILNFLPTQYGDEWITKSAFSITKDTTILGIPNQLTLTVNDSAYSIIDAWGKISTPMGEFDCLRMKSYVTMNEQVLLNNTPVKTKKARVINYNWVVKNYGIVMRIASHTNEKSEKFTNARLYSRMIDFTAATPTRVTEQLLVPETVQLYQNYPNPFNPRTLISFHLGKRDLISLFIFNVKGAMVAKLINNEQRNQGNYTVEWNGNDAFGNPAPSGIYIYRLSSPSFSLTRKMTLLK